MGKGCHWLSELIPVELTLKLIRMVHNWAYPS